MDTGSAHPLAQAILAKAAAEKAPIPPAGEASAIGGKGVTGKVGGMPAYLGSAASAGERAPLGPEITALIAALTDEGKTVSVLLAGNEVAGLIAMRDEPRPDPRRGLAALKRPGIGATMVTGDNARTAASTAASLGIEPRADLLPEDKLRINQALTEPEVSP